MEHVRTRPKERPVRLASRADLNRWIDTYQDTGCRYGGERCLECALPECVSDMTRAERTRVIFEWKRGGT